MFTSNWNIGLPGRVTLAGAVEGHDARLVAEVAQRLKNKPVLFVALDDMRAASMSDALGFFAPHCEVVQFPAWDCLPYDRISPHSDVSSARLSALSRLQQPFHSLCVVITTINAITQKTLPAHILSQSILDARVGGALPQDKLRDFLVQNGYINAGTVREAGEFAVRGGIVDIFPSGYEAPLRLDFFGDEIESVRVFDPLSQTTMDKIDGFYLGPVSEAIMTDASVSNFRSGYRALFGAVTDGDALYESVTNKSKFPGVEHWLGLFYPNLKNLFDFLPDSPVLFDHQSFEAMEARFQQIEDFYQARLGLYQAAKRNKNRDCGVPYKPAPVSSLYMDMNSINSALENRPHAVFSPFDHVQL